MLRTRDTADLAAADALLQEPGDAAIVVVALGAKAVVAFAGGLRPLASALPAKG
jgi:hypothetical protein